MKMFAVDAVFREWLLRPVVAAISNLRKDLMTTLDDVKAEADQTRALVTTLISAGNTSAATIADLQTRLAAAIAAAPSDADTAELQAIHDELGSVNSDLTAATAAATPPAPVVVPAT